MESSSLPTLPMALRPEHPSVPQWRRCPTLLAIGKLSVMNKRLTAQGAVIRRQQVQPLLVQHMGALSNYPFSMLDSASCRPRDGHFRDTTTAYVLNSRKVLSNSFLLIRTTLFVRVYGVPRINQRDWRRVSKKLPCSSLD